MTTYSLTRAIRLPVNSFVFSTNSESQTRYMSCTISKIRLTIVEIGCVTADNASPMDVMARQMGKKLGAFLGEKHRVRCFSHSINLVAKSFLCLFNPQKKKKKKRKTADVAPEDATEPLSDQDNDDDVWGALREAADAIAAGDDVLLTEEEQAALNVFLLAVEQEEADNEDLVDDDNEDTEENVYNEDGLIECDADIEEDLQEATDLETEAKPIRRALIKVSICLLTGSVLISLLRFVPSLFRSLTRQHFSFPPGRLCSGDENSVYELYRATCTRDGILRMTCSTLLYSIATLSTNSPCQPPTNYASGNCPRMNGHCWKRCIVASRYVGFCSYELPSW